MTQCSDGGGAEERQRFLLELSDALRTLADPLEIQAEACRRLGEHLGVNRVNYAEIEREAFVAVPGFVDGVAPLPSGAHPIANFGESLFVACRRGEDLVVDDVSMSPLLTPVERHNFERVQVGAFAAVPLTKAGRWVGIFSAQSASPRQWSALAVQLIREVAERIWAAVERARAEQALRESELRYRTLFERMGQGFAVKELIRDENGSVVDLRYVEVNGRFEQLIGWNRVAILGRLRRDTLGVDERWLRLCQGVVDSGEQAHVEQHFSTLGRWFEISLFPYAGGQLAALYDDITVNKLAEERLRASEARQAFLLLLSDRLRLLSDPREIMRVAAEMLGRHLEVATVQYTLLEANQENAQMGGVYNDGRLPAALEGFRFKLSGYGEWAKALRAGQEVFTSDNRDVWHGLVAEKTPATGLRAGAAIPLLEDGQLIAVLTAAHPEPRAWAEDEKHLLRDAATHTFSAVLRARSEAALRESEAAARCANQAKDEFLATLGHELRTPLSAILLWAGALKAGSVPAAELERAVEAILTSAQSQSRLIEDLLDLSRLASGKLVLAPDNVVVEGAARAAIQLVQASAQAKGVTLELVVGDCLGAAVLDASRLQQILLNLLSNAIKFTPRGGKATLRLRKAQGFLEVEVRDNGQGIARDFMPHIFERFRQADMGDSRSHSGLGIGLALSRQLVELQGGTITAHSAGEGMGALFRVRLPWLDAEHALPQSSFAATSPVVRGEARLQGVTVLLVEDDASTRDAMQWTLTRAGTTVVRATSGPEALELLEAGERGRNGSALPDVILSDLGLPGMSGYELIRHIVDRQRSRGQPPIPACAVSAHARDVDKLRAIDAGFDMYLVKPVTPEKLIEAIEDLRAVAATPISQ
jgi:signal transduction histidine kinase/PAS domain-containing protein/ActR/RegA family two-component response regulator